MKAFAAGAAVLILSTFSAPASACQTLPSREPQYDLIADGRWHYLNDHDVRIDIKRTIVGRHLHHLTIEGVALPEDDSTIIVTCGSRWRFTRESWPDGRTYKGRFFLLKSRDGSYWLHHFVERGKE